MTDCPFCSIISGKIPSWIIYKSDCVFGFLPRKMDAYGHTIIAPVTHIEDIYHVDSDILKKLIVSCKEIALLYNKKLGATGVNLLHASGFSAQQSIQHIHFHLIPRFDNDGLNAWPDLPGSTANNDQLLEIITRGR